MNPIAKALPPTSHSGSGHKKLGRKQSSATENSFQINPGVQGSSARFDGRDTGPDSRQVPKTTASKRTEAQEGFLMYRQQQQQQEQVEISSRNNFVSLAPKTSPSIKEDKCIFKPRKIIKNGFDQLCTPSIPPFQNQKYRILPFSAEADSQSIVFHSLQGSLLRKINGFKSNPSRLLKADTSKAALIISGNDDIAFPEPINRDIVKGAKFKDESTDFDDVQIWQNGQNDPVMNTATSVPTSGPLQTQRNRRPPFVDQGDSSVDLDISAYYHPQPQTSHSETIPSLSSLVDTLVHPFTLFNQSQPSFWKVLLLLFENIQLFLAR